MGVQPLDVLASHTAPGERLLLGLTGPPGAGKSTLAETLATGWAARGGRPAVVPMDGFHLPGDVLAARGLADVKGAPETFDAAGFVALLQRLRRRAGDVRAPAFDRDRERVLADAVVVTADRDLVLVEGNYLLADGAYAPVRGLLDLCWYLDLPDAVRVSRLVARHVAHRRTPQAASEWVHRSDEANARLVARTGGRADASWDVSTGRLGDA